MVKMVAFLGVVESAAAVAELFRCLRCAENRQEALDTVVEIARANAEGLPEETRCDYFQVERGVELER